MSVSVDPQQQRFLDLLGRAGGEAVSYADLRGAGIAFPAAVAAELELRGYQLDRVARSGSPPGVRLRDPDRESQASVVQTRLRRR